MEAVDRRWRWVNRRLVGDAGLEGLGWRAWVRGHGLEGMCWRAWVGGAPAAHA